MARIDTRNRSRYWLAPVVPGLSCLAADFTDHDYAPHRHDAYVVAVTEAGGSEFRSRGTTDEAKTSVLLVFNPDEPHSGRMARSERWRYRALYLAAPGIEAMRRAAGLRKAPYFTENVVRDRDLIDAFLSLHRALDAKDDAFEQHELFVASFGQLFRRHGSHDARIELRHADRRRVEVVRDLMRAQYAETLSLDDMGAEVGLTTFQLIGLFKRATGLTPHAYLTQVRLKAAIRAMKTGTPIAEAAIAAGFYDQAALTNHFKRSYGITPLQWVRAAQA